MITVMPELIALTAGAIGSAKSKIGAACPIAIPRNAPEVNNAKNI